MKKSDFRIKESSGQFRIERFFKWTETKGYLWWKKTTERGDWCRINYLGGIARNQTIGIIRIEGSYVNGLKPFKSKEKSEKYIDNLIKKHELSLLPPRYHFLKNGDPVRFPSGQPVPPPPQKPTPKQQALDNTVTLWASLVNCNFSHPDAMNEFRFHIHAIQNAIAADDVFGEINSRPMAIVRHKPSIKP